MRLRFLWSDATPPAARRGVREQLEPLVAAAVRTPPVRAHLVRLALGLGTEDPAVLVAGADVAPTKLADALAQRAPAVAPLLTAFHSGVLEGYVLMVFSTRGAVKLGVEVVLGTPPTVLHVPELRDEFAALGAEGLGFSAPVGAAVAALVNRSRWAVEAAAFYATDCAFFVEMQFGSLSLEPVVRFNTGRGLAAAGGAWAHALLAFAADTAAWFPADEPLVFVSLLLSPVHHAVVGVRLTGRGGRARTARSDRGAGSARAPSATPDGPAALPPP